MKKALTNIAIALMTALALFAIAYIWIGQQEHPEYAYLWLLVFPGSCLAVSGMILAFMAFGRSSYRTNPGFIAVAILNIMLAAFFLTDLSAIRGTMLIAIVYAALITGIGLFNLLLWELLQLSRKSETAENEKRPPGEQPFS